MPSLNGKKPTGTGQAYWRSLEQLAETPEFREFMHREFPAGASELVDGDDRRHFLKIMGASLALAGLGLSGCRRWPREEIHPYAARPEGHVPGTAEFFATCRDQGGVATSLLVTSNEFRPTKVDGNPDHAGQMGASSVFDQATVLDVYDPDRSRGVLKNGESSSWDAFNTWLGEFRAAAGNGAGVAVLSEATSSPSVKALKARLQSAMPSMTWVDYEPLARDNDIAGTELAFGSAHRTRYFLQDADVIVTLDADLFGSHPDAISNMRGYAAGRRPRGDEKSMSRFYAFESGVTITGARADERAAVRSSDIPALVAALAQRILGDGPWASAGDAIGNLSAAARERIEWAAEDLVAHGGRGLVAVGASQAPEVHAMVHLINQQLTNTGNTVSYLPTDEGSTSAADISALAQQMASGAISTLFIIGGNPVYNAPANAAFGDAMANVATTVHLSDYVDETSDACTWHLNRAHYLEAWGDGRSWDGTYCLGQPMIRPLFGGKSAIELLAAMAGDASWDGRAIVRSTFDAAFGGGEKAWRSALHDGFVDGSSAAGARVQVSASNAPRFYAAMMEGWQNAGSGMEVVFVSDPTVYDGRFANNGWLQELPDPLTKITWDNAAIISVAKAEELGINAGDLVSVKVGDASVTAACFALPGHNDDTVTLTLGYGRAMKGRICTGSGFNFYPLRTSNGMNMASGSISAAGGSYALATTQDHHAIDVEALATKAKGGVLDRLPSLIREAELEEYRHHPEFADHRTHIVHNLSLWKEDRPFHDSGDGRDADYAWGMTIDLNTCTGCNACVVACQAENNIPIVGKDQVTRGREMHWLRLDRYFKFGKDNDDKYSADRFEGVRFQPVACVHCENAACEQVCPVAATVHDADGLNVMVYNRCIGTRYCSNNCPYKVRRFNYFDYHRRKPHREQPGTLLQVEPEYYTRSQAGGEELPRMQRNPEVSVRVRGVMEKCTYCLQRIYQARIDAKNEWVKLPQNDPRREGRVAPIADGTVKTACQVACPAQAIEFGDLKDPRSKVTAGHRDARAYDLLGEINPKPRTKYMAMLTNPKHPTYDPSEDHGHGHGHGDDHSSDDHNHSEGDGH